MLVMELAPLTPQHIEGELKKAGFNTLDEFAYDFVLTTGGAGTTEKMQAKYDISPRIAHALQVNPAFRSAVDKYVTLEALDYGKRRQQIDGIIDISINGQSEKSRLDAFDTVSRQAGMKVPERQEIDDKKTINITISRLDSREGGYEPGTPYRPPVSRRRRLGEIIDVGVSESPQELTLGSRPRGLPGKTGSPLAQLGVMESGVEEGDSEE